MKVFLLSTVFSILIANVDLYISDVNYSHGYVEVSIETNEDIVGFQFEINPSPNLNAEFLVEDIDLINYGVTDSNYWVSGYQEEWYMDSTAVNGVFELFGNSEGLVIGFNLGNPAQYIDGTGEPQKLVRVPWTYEVGQIGSISIGENPRFIKRVGGGSPPQYIQTTITEDFALSIEEIDIPSEFILNKAFPNPFNPKTQIGFGLPYSTNVKLAIYGIDGRYIKTLVSSFMAGGFHSTEWDGKDASGNNVSTGIYLYQLIAGNVILSEKVLLVK